jgi:hypothetical protein
LDIFINLRNRKFARKIVIEEDRAGSDEIKATFLLEDSRIGSASESPELDEDVRAICVDGIRNL